MQSAGLRSLQPIWQERKKFYETIFGITLAPLNLANIKARMFSFG
jgi:hypothetical protein